MIPPEASRLLSAFLDGELSQSDLLRVEKELAQSPEWRAELARLRAAKDGLSALGRVEAPDDLIDDLIDKFGPRPPDDN